ncbi:MAG: hypothetical protein J6O99_03115, partial [Methanobrevibacter sp.]|nr:hypothetical protein [Methanobrevibacter sp.]
TLLCGGQPAIGPILGFFAKWYRHSASLSFHGLRTSLSVFKIILKILSNKLFIVYDLMKISKRVISEKVISKK